MLKNSIFLKCAEQRNIKTVYVQGVDYLETKMAGKHFRLQINHNVCVCFD